MTTLANPLKPAAAGDVPGEPSSRWLGADGGVYLYWLPLGAGGRSVRVNGRVFEWLSARRAHRSPLDIYHAALEVHVAEGRYVIEMTPVTDGAGERPGVVAEGAVGSRQAGRLRLFRYEVRCWRDGAIPDVAEAVASPVHVSADLRLNQLASSGADRQRSAAWSEQHRSRRADRGASPDRPARVRARRPRQRRRRGVLGPDASRAAQLA